MVNPEVFIKITNADIYKSIKESEEKNTKEHKIMEEHLIKTNGKVKFNAFIGRTALTISILGLGIITGINFYLKYF